MSWILVLRARSSAVSCWRDWPAAPAENQSIAYAGCRRQLGQGGSGGGATACNAPQDGICGELRSPAVMLANSPGGPVSISVGRRRRSPPRPRAVDQHRRRRALLNVGKPYLDGGLEPRDGPAHGQDGRHKVTCGTRWPCSASSIRPSSPACRPGRPASRPESSRKYDQMGDEDVARTAILVPLLVGAMGASALGAGGKRAGVPKFDGAQEVVVRKPRHEGAQSPRLRAREVSRDGDRASRTPAPCSTPTTVARRSRRSSRCR